MWNTAMRALKISGLVLRVSLRSRLTNRTSISLLRLMSRELRKEIGFADLRSANYNDDLTDPFIVFHFSSEIRWISLS